jgi:hypothetical protein
MTMNQEHPSFKHRFFQDDDSSPIDLYTAVIDAIENIATVTEILSMSAESHNEFYLSDETQQKFLNQINLSAMDVVSIMEWFINNHEISKIDEK